MTRTLRALSCLALFLAAWAGSAEPASAQRSSRGGRVNYLIDFVPGSSSSAFEITINVSGLKRTDDLSFAMSDWGDWQGRSTDLRVVESEPPLLVNDRERRYFVPDLRTTGVSDARFVYRLKLGPPGSLRPTRAEDYAFAWLENTLLDVRLGGESLVGQCTVTVNAPPAWPFADGWAGAALGSQDEYLPTPLGNGPLAFGQPAAELLRTFGGLDVEVFQYGDGPDITDTVAEVVGRCGPDLAVSFGRPMPSPYRAFVTDHQAGSMGSAYGLRVASMPGEQAEEFAGSPGLRMQVTQELLQHWMSQAVPGDDPAVDWLRQGLVGYLAAWQCASTGVVSRDAFARRLFELEALAQKRPAWGRDALGDTEEGSDPVLASAGGPVLFLAMDAALREADEPGLPALVQHLLDAGDRSDPVGSARAWALEHGLRGLWVGGVDKADIPSVAESLARLGFREVEGATGWSRFTSEGADARLDAAFRFRLPNSQRR